MGHTDDGLIRLGMTAMPFLNSFLISKNRFTSLLLYLAPFQMNRIRRIPAFSVRMEARSKSLLEIMR